MIELAVVPPSAIRFLQREDRDVVRGSECLHLATPPVADPFQQHRRRDLVAQMLFDEPVDLRADLQPLHVSVQIQPIDTLDLQRDVPVEHIVDVHHSSRHPNTMNA
jgi:hypothetical protein